MTMAFMAQGQMSGENCFNLNFSNPGGTAPFQSLLLSPKQECSSDELAAADSDGSKESTPTTVHMNTESVPQPNALPNGKKTKGRVKIEMKYIGNKLRRYTTFSKRKTGIMKKAHELSTLTGTQVMLLVASETGHVYAFSTNKLKPIIANEPGRSLIHSCLTTPADPINDCTSVKTEFTFEPNNGSLSNVNPRKRKAQDITETLSASIPTMVSSASSVEPYVDSDNDTNGYGDDEEIDKNQILKEVMKAASEQRQKQRRKDNKKPAENALAALLANCDNNINQFLPMLLQGLTSTSSSSSSPVNPSTSTDNNNSDKPLEALNSTSHTENNGQVMFQMPQGVVYTNTDANLESHSTAPSPGSSSTDNDALQQFLMGSNLLQNLLNVSFEGKDIKKEL
ncbi:unnamed protein product [Bursaphelenchus okinawaensis]|uniref:Serum response factor homolog n=1 Tax=Bursaphelenchus okinawaensis TaxID=465554 RepID=A0A811L8V6_9BILA|nr:unnamed protein product [Bursaphelenchus okinawaensis]CAG9119705.1 unnamed protein product [Bursaphelenchus okinawaensis]